MTRNCSNCSRKAQWTTPRGALCGLCVRALGVSVDDCQWIKGAEESGFRESFVGDYHTDAMRTRYANRKASGLCVRCGDPVKPGKTLCEMHLEYDRNRERMRQQKIRTAMSREATA